MSKKKKQHYVPRFYLRHFSNHRDGKTIGVYNIKGDTWVPAGSLKNQAYADFFYGKDGVIEEALHQLESKAAVVISDIVQRQLPPQLHSEDHKVLLAFVVMLSNRTMYAADTTNEMLDKLIKTVYKNDPRVKDELDSVVVEFENAAAFILPIVVKSLPVATDLHFKLLVNDTKLSFITSDNPVVQYNQFLEPKPTVGGKAGLGTKGLQILIPLSPETAIIFYDPSVYKVGTKKAKAVHITDEEDINQLNLLQVVNANSNLYFNQRADRPYIEALIKRSKKYMRAHKGNVAEYPLIGGHSEKSTIIHMHSEEVRTRLKLTFVSVRKKAKKYELGNKAVHVRNPKLVDEIEETLDRDRQSTH